MEKGDKFIPQEPETPAETGIEVRGESSDEQSVSRWRRIARMVLGLPDRSTAARPLEPDIAWRPYEELTRDTVSDFAVSQFEHARVEFLAWFEVAQCPQNATVHPLVVEKFGDTLDPEDAAEILEWWAETMGNFASGLVRIHQLLTDGLELNSQRIEKVLSITSNAEHCVGNLLRHLDDSRLQNV